MLSSIASVEHDFEEAVVVPEPGKNKDADAMEICV
jgi:hypothetical protein